MDQRTLQTILRKHEETRCEVTELNFNSTWRTPQEPPGIRPVANAAGRPRWSVMIPVYNAGDFLQQTLQSVLDQAENETEMQIEVVDDCSSDQDVQSLVNTLGKGRVSYFRQRQNVGSLRNFETCLNRSRGQFVHLLHSDDIVHPGYYRKMDQLFASYPQAGAAFCRYQYIDEKGGVLFTPRREAAEDGLLEDWLVRLAERQRIQYVSISVRRKVYEELGGFFGVHYGEDWEMWMRVGTRYRFAYTPEVLASYRRHENSISGQAVLTAGNLRDLLFVIEKINDYLPVASREKAKKEALRFYAYYAVRTAKRIWIRNRHTRGALAQMKQGWSMHKDGRLALEILKLLTRMLINR